MLAFISCDNKFKTKYNTVDNITLLCFRVAPLFSNYFYDKLNAKGIVAFLEKKNWLISSPFNYDLKGKTSTENPEERKH